MLASRHLEIFVMIFASILAIYVGSQIVTLPIPLLAILLSAIFLFCWSLTAGNAWWVPVLASAQVYGIFKVGVKVSPPMVGIALAVLGLVPLILVQNHKVLQRQRRPLPFVFYATALYIIIRLGIDIIPAAGERNNMYRVLFDAIWPFFFGFLFHHYGNLSMARAAVGTVFVILLIRCGAAIVGYITGLPIYVPGIDYVLSRGAEDSLSQMRSVGATLLMVILIIFHSSRSSIIKIGLVPMMLASCALVVMGQGRFATFMMLLLPAFFFAWSRRWIPLFAAACVGFGALAVVNVVPQSLDDINPAVARSLSGLVIGGVKSNTQQETKASDVWHDSLRVIGFQRWTQSPLTVLLGYGIRPTPDYYAGTFGKSVDGAVLEQAANLGGFECALWGNLEVLGLVGVGLYTLVFIYLWRQALPYLFRRPVGGFWEGIVFWGCYASLSTYVVAYFQGGFPSLELILMIIAADAIQDGKLDQEKFENRPLAARTTNFMQLSPPLTRA